MEGEATQEDGSRGLAVSACTLRTLQDIVLFASSVAQGFHCHPPPDSVGPTFLRTIPGHTVVFHLSLDCPPPNLSEVIPSSPTLHEDYSRNCNVMMTNVCPINCDTATIVFLSHVGKYTAGCANWQNVGQTDAFRHTTVLISCSSTGAWGEQTAQLGRKGRCSLLIRFLTLYLFVHFGTLPVHDFAQQSTSGQ